MKRDLRSPRDLVALTVLIVAAALGVDGAAAQERDPLPVPDLPGLKTLKADFHLHTVFSDGQVWPTVHVSEAWRDGLDAIALTDHVEYHPHASDVAVDLRRPYEVARPLADELGIILIPGVEITRPAPGSPATIPVGSGHFNALFVTDPKALEVPDLQEALRRAHAQGAFVFWNHPGFMGTLEPRWHPHVEGSGAGQRQGLLSRGLPLDRREGPDHSLQQRHSSPHTAARGGRPAADHAALRPHRGCRGSPGGAGGPAHRGLAGRRRVGRRGAPARLVAGRGPAPPLRLVRTPGPAARRAGPERLGHPLPPAPASGPHCAQGVRGPGLGAPGSRDRPGAGHLAPIPARRARRAHGQRIALEVEVSNLHVGPGHELVVTIPLEITVGP